NRGLNTDNEILFVIDAAKGIYTDRVSYWKNSDQRQRWVGTALQEIEPKLRTVRGYRHLRELRELRDAMRNLNYKENIFKVA
ncbi:MAG: hypothetical protein VX186_00895, partial [Nitrospinota bacterium]|nr:hypothetical protein [Nitrospinota bacterium]